MTQPVPVVNVTDRAGEEIVSAKRRISLRSRVALLAAACVAGSVALASLGAYLIVNDNLYQQVDVNLTARA